jgi:hypothetical protein
MYKTFILTQSSIFEAGALKGVSKKIYLKAPVDEVHNAISCFDSNQVPISLAQIFLRNCPVEMVDTILAAKSLRNHCDLCYSFVG